MNNFIHPGDVCTYVAPLALASGQGFQVGSEFAVALAAAASGAMVEGMPVGVFDLPKSGAASTDFVAGTKLYWDNTNKVVTKTATNNLFIGYARRDALAADTSCRIRLPGATS